MRIPDQLTAGDSISWKDDAARDNLGNAVTCADWTLTYYIRGEKALSVVGAPDGQGWLTTISASQSATLTKGSYFWQAVATKGSDRITLGSGTLTVAADLSFSGDVGTFDGRTEAEKALAAIDAEINARLTGGMAEEYTIGNRSLKKTPMRDLVALQSRYKTIVTRERQAQKIAQGLGNPRAMYVRF